MERQRLRRLYVKTLFKEEDEIILMWKASLMQVAYAFTCDVCKKRFAIGECAYNIRKKSTYSFGSSYMCGSCYEFIERQQIARKELESDSE